MLNLVSKRRTGKLLYVPYVESGLAAGLLIFNQNGGEYSQQRIQVDCGAANKPKAAFRDGLRRIEPNIFFLSHIHHDHYNGIAYGCEHGTGGPFLDMEAIYFPRISELAAKHERLKFLIYLQAISTRLLGDLSGSAEWDFLSLMQKLSRTEFKYQPLSQGDVVPFNDGSSITVLWPPKLWYEKETPRAVRKAIEDFEKALKEDPLLKEIVDTLYARQELSESSALDQGGHLKPLTDYEKQKDAENSAVDRCGHAKFFTSQEYKRLLRTEPIPECTRKANNSLRKAANHFSLAFRLNSAQCWEGDLLFLGDLEKCEINKVVQYLKVSSRSQFTALLTPHHGTHWHESLRQIKATLSITSVGPSLVNKVKRQFAEISKLHLITEEYGHVKLYYEAQPRFCNVVSLSL